MKKCPVCSAHCFDDMKQCFGCMHHFDDDEFRVLETAQLPAVQVLEDIDEPPTSLESSMVARVPLPAKPCCSNHASPGRCRSGKRGHASLRQKMTGGYIPSSLQELSESELLGNELPLLFDGMAKYQIVVSFEPVRARAQDVPK